MQGNKKKRGVIYENEEKRILMGSPSTFSQSENFFGQSSLLLSILSYLLRTSCRRSQTKLPCSEDWCKRRDLNPHVFRHWILSPARLPIPPLLHICERKSLRYKIDFYFYSPAFALFLAQLGCFGGQLSLSFAQTIFPNYIHHLKRWPCQLKL